MSEYKITIGLEIHAELKTKSKMFCTCANKSAHDAEKPNIYICPICMGHPGTLPVINKEAVKKVLLVGSAVGSKLADFTEFDRKNYFYPDIPKGYQISQYKYPLVSGGSISGVELTRIHLEEDTARSTHPEGKSKKISDEYSLVDFNRAGVPLLELVTEPVIHSSEQAVAFAKELQLILQYLNVSDANMEKGEMRVEVNFSISKDENFGTKVEIKNLNSFRSVGRAIDFEFKRQSDLLDRGEKIVQETRGWDENNQSTFSQRVKESAHDYRYFPDPDLPKLIISEIPEFSEENLRNELPELPWEKREKYEKEFRLKNSDIEIYVNNKRVADFFESATAILGSESGAIQTASNYITTDLIGMSKGVLDSNLFGKINEKNFVSLIKMILAGDISSRGAKDILKVMFENGGEPKTIAEENQLLQKNNEEELKEIILKIISSNQKVVDEYKSGKESVLQFLVGQGMKETKGSANPEILKKIILELIKK